MNNLELKIKSFCDIGVSLDTEIRNKTEYDQWYL